MPPAAIRSTEKLAPMEAAGEVLALILLIQGLECSRAIIVIAAPGNAETAAATNNRPEEIRAKVKLCPELYTA